MYLSISPLRFSARTCTYSSLCLRFDYTADDLRRALEHMAHVAQWWDFQSYRDKIFLEPFMTQMTPLQFQLQIKQSFGVVTTVRDSLRERFSSSFVF